MTKRVMTAVMLLTLAALLAACGTGGSGLGGVTTGTVSGTITNADTDDKVTQTVDLEIARKEGASSNGVYSIPGVPTGHRTLVAKATGYHTFEQAILVKSGNNVFDFEMKQIEDMDNLLPGTVVAPPVSHHAHLPITAWGQLMAFVTGPVAQAQQLDGETPVAGANVQAYEWDTGEPVGEAATTASDGSFTLVGVPHGMTVLIRVTKGDDLRLTYIVPSVDPETPVNVNTHSTFVAEIMGPNFGTLSGLDTDELDAVESAVTNLLNTLTINDLDLRIMAGWVSDKFGGEIHVNQALLDIREGEVTLISSIAHTQHLIGVLRNTWPTLIALGTPIIGDVGAEITETIAPIFSTVNERLAIIAALVANADLDWDELGEGDDPFLFSADSIDYKLITTIMDVTVEGDDNDVKNVKSTFVVVSDPEDVDEIPIASGSMDFKQKKDEPITWTDLEVTFTEEDNDAITELTVGAEIDFEWELDPNLTAGDYRDLKLITINTREISGGGDDTRELMMASGTLIASMDVREWLDAKGERIPMPTRLDFTDGTIKLPLPDSTPATLKVDHILFTLTPDEGTFDRDEYTLNADLTAYIGDESDAELSFTGTFNASGVHISGDEGPGTGEWGRMESEFDGQITLAGREPVTIQFVTDRTGQDEIELGDDFTIVAQKVTFTGSGSVQIDRGEEYGDFIGAIISLVLMDENEYVINVDITLSEGEHIDVEGEVTLGDDRLANITSVGYDVPTVIYDPDNEIADKWFTESLF